MRPQAENALMNVVATAVAADILGLEAQLGIDIISVTSSYSTGVVFAASQVGFAGMGTYDRLKHEFIQTSNKVYPYSNETSDGSQMPIKGATYSAFFVAMKVDNQTRGDYNTVPTEYFEYIIYVNNACSAWLSCFAGWLNTLNNLRTALTFASDAYEAAWTAYTPPLRVVYPTSAYNYTTGKYTTPAELLPADATGMQVTT
jgi:hypothetical protein